MSRLLVFGYGKSPIGICSSVPIAIEKIKEWNPDCSFLDHLTEDPGDINTLIGRHPLTEQYWYSEEAEHEAIQWWISATACLTVGFSFTI